MGYFLQSTGVYPSQQKPATSFGQSNNGCWIDGSAVEWFNVSCFCRCSGRVSDFVVGKYLIVGRFSQMSVGPLTAYMAAEGTELSSVESMIHNCYFLVVQ